MNNAENQITTLNQQISSLKQQVADLSNINNQLKQTQVDLSKLTSENSELKQQIVELTENNKKLQDENTELTSKYSALEPTPNPPNTSTTSITEITPDSASETETTLVKQKSNFPWQLGPVLLPAVNDIKFTAIDDDDIKWDAGTITFADKSKQNITAGSLRLSNNNTYYLYAIVGNPVLKDTQVFGNSVGGDNILIAFVNKAENPSSKVLITRK